MRKTRKAVLSVVLGTLLLFLLFPMMPLDIEAQGPGNSINRVSAEFKRWDGTEQSTAALPAALGTGGALIYSKTIVVPNLASLSRPFNTIYVTISTTGDNHGSAALMLACLVDGAPCNPGAGGAGGAPTGWITLEKHFDYNAFYGPGIFFGDGGGGAGDLHDNNITYEWCKKITPGTRTVTLRMASSTGSNVFLEGIHVYIDLARVQTACTQAL